MRKPSPSMVVSVIALIAALGGTSYAAVKITSKDVRNNSLTTKDVKNRTLRAKDFRTGVLPSASRWVLVGATGQIEAQSGGFQVASAYRNGAMENPGPAGNVYIDANEDLTDNAIVATIALQNQADQNGDGIKNGRADMPNANPEFSGEITATRCAIAGVVACAPTGTDTAEHFVVSPRQSDGRVTDGTNRKRFYVVISGDSRDYVAP